MIGPNRRLSEDSAAMRSYRREPTMVISPPVSDAPRDDAELLSAWRDGDNKSGDKLVKRHFWAVFGFFRTKVHDAASDLTQQTFLACVESRDRIDAKRSFRSYLFGIARNKLLHFLRAHYRKPDQVDPSRMSVYQAGQQPGFVTMREDQRLLIQALHRLPIDFQITMELFYWWDLTVPEIAAALDVAPGTVKSRMARARGMLKESIENIDASEAAKKSTIQALADWKPPPED